MNQRHYSDPSNYYNYNGYYNNYLNGEYYNSNNNERVGFLGPFILGGIAGGLAAPLFYNNGYGGYNNYPYNYNNYYYPPYYYY